MMKDKNNIDLSLKFVLNIHSLAYTTMGVSWINRHHQFLSQIFNFMNNRQEINIRKSLENIAITFLIHTF